MTPELTALTLAALLQIIQFTLYAVSAQKQVGRAYAASSRDEPRTLTGTAGRLQRALTNHFEALVLFTIATIVTVASGQSSSVTATAAWIYLIARIAYVPAYAFDWVPWRSLIWAIGLIATATMLIAALI